MKWINLTLDEELHGWVHRLAKEERKPATVFLRDLILERMRAHPAYKAEIKAKAKQRTQ